MDTKKIPGVICSSENDLQYLFEYSLITCLKKIDFLNELFVVTPNPEIALKVISKIVSDCRIPIHIVKDDELLSKSENKMCGWSKQQILKLRSYEICEAENILSVGADTVTLNKLFLNDFCTPQNIVVNYRNHKTVNKHFRFEINRVKNIYNLFGITTTSQNENLHDFIFDIFLFKSSVLLELNRHLTKKFGSDYFLKILPHHVSGYGEMEKIGEWSLYTIFAIEVLKCPFVFQDGTALLHQIHTESELRNYDYKNKAVHFVRKDFNKKYIFAELKKNEIL